MVEKFKILPRVPAGKNDKEESKKDDSASSKKVTMGRGYFSLEKATVDDKPVYLVVFRNLIGKTLYQGSVSAQHSKKRRIEEKALKLQLKLALLAKDP
jgi:hypothetical protein